MLNVLDEEGVRLSEPKLKLIAIEPVKSSHTRSVVVKLKKCN